MTTIGKSFFSNKVQEIITTLDGVISQSSDTIFVLKEGENILKFHPFFESLENELKYGDSNNLAFPCVQLDTSESEVICDITIKKESGFLAILLFDYSNHYEHLHDATQEKKTAMLNEQAYELNTKYYEEKKAYLELIQDQINNNIVRELEDVVLKLEELAATDLSKQQNDLIIKLQKNIISLQDKALQIKEGLLYE